MNKITLLIHGPFAGSGYHEIFKNFNLIDNKVKKDISIVSVVYEADKEEYLKEIGSMTNQIKTVYIKDCFNPGYFNINRQIRSVNAGLKVTDEGSYVIKLRNDQWVDFNKLFRIIEKNKLYNQDKILTTNCYTRKDRLYHPSDMLLCGQEKYLQQMYDLKEFEATAQDTILNIQNQYNTCKEPFFKYMISPENIIFRNYLEHRKWVCKDTLRDSYDAIKKYCYVINSWNIDYRWKKNRVPFLPQGSVILPYRIKVSPFPGVCDEDAECYHQADFGIEENIIDKFYLGLANILFKFRYGNQRCNYNNFLLTLGKIGRILPLRYRKFFKKGSLFQSYKKLVWGDIDI